MSLRVRVLITAVVLLHLTAVVDVLTGDASTLSRGWTRTTMTAQSWDMFSKPRPKGWGMEAFGVHEDGTRERLMVSKARVEPGIQLRYSRLVKVQQNAAIKGGDRTRQGLADWYCQMHPELVRVEIEQFNLLRPTMKEYRGNPDATVGYEVFITREFPCTR